jgi:glycosyltransferase involved in cell wall biosynthesis
MKVCIVAMTGLYPIDLGGPGSPAYFLSREFNKNDIEVYLFINADNEKVNRLKETKEYKELTKTKIIPIHVKYDLKHTMNPLYYLKKIFQINTELKKIMNDFDVIFYNSPPVDISFFFPFLCEGKKQFFALHGGLFYEGKNYVGKILIKLQKKRFQKIIAVSYFSKKLAENFGFRSNKINVINNGVDIEIIQDLKPFELMGNPKILYVGAMRKIKGVDILLKAFSLFLKDFSNSQLYLVGSGKEKNNLIKLSKTLGIDNHVHFVGFIPLAEDVLRYYKSCDLFVMPSYKENFPLVILEAIASNTPVILSDIPGGPQELINHGKNGLLFNAGDYHSLYLEMKKIFDNTEWKNKMITEASDMIKNYDWNKIADDYILTFGNKNFQNKE